ncbi:MAG: GuaB1 family IMP dehydrogenase-related protein [Patescibacteria group bacterium]
MNFLNPTDRYKEFTYDDVFLLPGYSDIDSRMDVDLMPVDSIGTNLPLVAANMTAVTGKRMAEVMARRGGIAVLPQDLPLEKIEYTIKYLKSCHDVFETPVVLYKNHTIQTALNLIHKRSHKAVIVINKKNQPVGVFTEKDAYQRDKFALLESVMSHDIITMPETARPEEIFKTMKQQRLHIMPIIKISGELAGVLTPSGCLRSTIYKPAKNTQGQFLTAVAVRINHDIKTKIKSLLSLGVDIIVLDAAHGYQKKMIQSIRLARSIVGDKRILVAGNVVGKSATKALINAGANIVKVGVGSGAMCTTRMMTGVGRPQFSAVYHCSQIARSMNANVWADGNIKEPRDVALALAAGASAVFVGSWLVGTYESSADMQYDEHGRLYKENFGMASARAVNNRTREEDIFIAARKQYFNEGISNSKIYLKKEEESVEDIIDKICAGLRSACTYTGARNLREFYEKATVGSQTVAGFVEGKPLSK